MVHRLAGGLLRLGLVALVGAGAFMIFGRITSHLVSSVGFQVGVAGMMGLVSAAVVHRVLTTTEIPRLLGRAFRGKHQS